ncbi:MAG: hypothetical protein QOD11_2790 [Bradyrhizobium sp.]|nr:hypothetical protein [Bradyrhizobium sp.]
MNKLLASTAVCLVLGTAAFAQSPNNSTTSPGAQPQNNSRDKDSSTQRAPDSAAQNQPSGSTQNQPSQNQSSQNQSSQNQPSQNQPSGSAQNQPSGSAKDQPSGSAQNQPSGSTANQPASNSAASQPAPAPSSNPSQAQSNPPSQSGSSPAPSQAQTNNPPAANNQAQQNSGNANTNQPAPANQGNTAQSHQTNVNASVNLNDQQRTRVSQSFARLNVQPVRNVNFSVSVGTVVPRDVHLQTVPADIVEIVPQYRGYSFFAVRDEIVIVDPASYKIVTVLPRSGGGTAAAPASSHSRVSFTDKDRDVVRKHVRSTERRTTGSSATRVEIRRGERVPDTVEIEEFPETVYREAPALREYRYIHRDSRTYVVEPTERRIIEEID